MRKTTIFTVATLLVGLGVGYSAGQLGNGGNQNATAEVDPNKPLYWVAPMDANYRRDKPGKSPMGMDLVPVYPGEETGGSNDALMIDAAVINNIGVRTTTATTRTLYREIETVGSITIDETKTSHVHVRAPGWVEKLHFKAVGEQVKKGDIVFELYSPDLVNAQREFLQAIHLKQANLVRASEERLFALGMSKKHVEQLQTTREVMQRIPVMAHNDGTIMKVNIGEGMYITPGTTVFSLADLSTIWVKADIFEAQSSWVKTEQVATMTLPFMPGETWEGTVDYIYPIVDAKSRTVQARLSFPNKDGRLKPNMYADIKLAAAPQDNVVAIPREALIRTGKTDRVILALDDGKFRPAEVVAGPESSDWVEIKEGLTAGERIVTSGQFLIDSEASTNSAYLRMLGAGDDSNPSDTDSAMEVIEGTINSIMENGQINLTHGPIEQFNMPGMTMHFRVAEAVDLSDFTEGDAVNFSVIQADDGWYVITHMTRQ